MNAIISTILSVSLCLGVAVAGAYAADAIETIGKETAPRDTMSRNAMPANTMSRSVPPSTMSRDAMSPHAMPRDSMSRNVPQGGAMAKDAMKKAPQTR